MYVLGIAQSNHGSSAALLDSDRIHAAVMEERFDRRKFSPGFPDRAIRFCLEQAGIGREDVEAFAYFMTTAHEIQMHNKPYSEQLRYYPEAFYAVPNRLLAGAGLPMPECVEQSFFHGERKTRIVYVDHHLAHICGAYYLSPFEDAAVLTLDSRGDGLSTTMGVCDGYDVRTIKRIPHPHSLGAFYTTITQFLGFVPNSDEYKVMGMAAYGSAEPFIDQVRALVRPTDDAYELDLSCFQFFVPASTRFNDKFIATFGPPRAPEDPIEQRHMDLAAATQKVLEENLIRLLNRLHADTGKSNLCMGGGVALNSLANGLILRDTPFERVFIPTHPGDSGLAIGAAQYVLHHVLGQPRNYEHVSDYLGPEFSTDDIRSFLDGHKIPYRETDDVYGDAAGLIADGNVVGWFQGRTEFGPRALGNRSILADPRREEMKDIVNHKIKFREPFRPFAPSILAERVAEYFDVPFDTVPERDPVRYMLAVYPVREEKRGVIPAVVHEDGTGRLQAVDKAENPRYHSLIQAFEKLTGVPVVLNTSFNIKGEPIVNTPQDAIRCFVNSGIDYVVLDRFIVSKSGL